MKAEQVQFSGSALRCCKLLHEATRRPALDSVPLANRGLRGLASVVAAQWNSPEIVKFYLCRGRNVKAVYRFEVTAVTQASLVGRADMVNLLERGGQDTECS